MQKKPARKSRVAIPKKIAAQPAVPPPWVCVNDSALIRSKYKTQVINPFKIPDLPPRVIPKSGGKAKSAGMALDEQIIEFNAWASVQLYNGAFYNGQAFLGYTALSEMAQRPEYRAISETLAEEMTRKWIELKSISDEQKKAGEKTKSGKIADLEAFLKDLDVQGACRRVAELDGFFGRSHLYLDTGSTDNPKELLTPIGDGRNAITLAKFKGRKGFLKAVRPVEPVWTYPANYNANNPLRADWYNPQTWYALGTEIDVSRLLKFVGREVPDLLKPSYMFGGLSLTQMAKPYVDNWLRTRQAVADLIWSFSLRILKTNLAASLGADGSDLFNRLAFFTNLQNNQGAMVVDKDTEDVSNIQTSLASLDALQAQAQEHMCSVSREPVVKLLGIQPAGLNASSEGELVTWYDRVKAFQHKFYDANLRSVIDFAMLSLWGEVDEDITFDYAPLRELTDKEVAEQRKIDADTHAIYVELGAIDPQEVRQSLVDDPDSLYDGLDPNDMPEGDLDADFGEEGQADLGDLVGQFGAREPRKNRDDDNERREEPRAAPGRNDRARASLRREPTDRQLTTAERGARE